MHMQRLLNNEDCKNRKIMKAINDIVPVNYDYDWSYHCENKTYIFIIIIKLIIDGQLTVMSPKS